MTQQKQRGQAGLWVAIAALTAFLLWLISRGFGTVAVATSRIIYPAGEFGEPRFDPDSGFAPSGCITPFPDLKLGPTCAGGYALWQNVRTKGLCCSPLSTFPPKPWVSNGG